MKCTDGHRLPPDGVAGAHPAEARDLVGPPPAHPAGGRRPAGPEQA
ncbi:hypothetical protein [Streptomyces sp. NPDC003877]